MKYGLALVLVFLLGGCSTLTTKFGEDPQWGQPYSGTKASPGNSRYYMGKATSQGPMVYLVFWGAIFDFLGSFGADTVVLPADLYFAVSDFISGDDEEEDEKNKKPDQSDQRPKRWL